MGSGVVFFRPAEKRWLVFGDACPDEQERLHVQFSVITFGIEFTGRGGHSYADSRKIVETKVMKTS